MFQDDVLSALRGSSPGHPVGIAHILNVVDARQRLVLTCDELNQALSALIAAGKAQEVGTVTYAAGRGSRPFTPVSAEAFEAAVAEYRRGFDAAAACDDDDSGTLVKLCFDTRRRAPSDTELDDFTDALEAQIGEVADVLGFEMGPGVVELCVLVDEGESAESVAAACALAAGAWSAVDGYHVEIVDPEGRTRRFP